MADSRGADLQRELQRQLVQLLESARRKLDAMNVLAQAGPTPAEFAGTALAPRLLTRLELPEATDDVLATFVLRGLRSLAPAGASAIAIHGWEEPASNRGLAYVFRSGGLLAAVAVSADASGPRLRLVLSGAGKERVAPALPDGWDMTVDGTVGATFEALLRPGGPPELSGATSGDTLAVSFERRDTGARFGLAPPGPGVKLGRVIFGGELRVKPDLDLEARGRVALSGGAVELSTEGLAGLVPGLGPIPLNIDLGLVRGIGAALGGATSLSVRLPVAGSPIPGVGIDALELSFEPQFSAQAISVSIGVRTALKVSLPFAGLNVRFDGLGLTLPFAVGEGVPLGFDAQNVRPVLPHGAGVDVDLPVIDAGGSLARLDSGGYSGSLSASLPPLSASAFGVLDPRSGEQPFSFLVLLGATFPPPGIQIGFGFAISGMGGILGVNRRVDREGLIRAVSDGSAAGLLFPTNAGASNEAAVRALPGIFPPARGSVVAGPMFQLSWGGRIATASVAVIVEVSATPRLTILGKLTIALPDPEVALIFIQATFAGQIDPGEPSVFFIASLAGSHIVGLPLTGDLCLLTRGGDDATFVLSAGGFHPAYRPPRGVPALRRLGMDMSPSPVIHMRVEAYVAVTTNTVQFGGRIELFAGVAGCGIRGELGLDALIQFRPSLTFIVDVGVRVAVTFLGETLVGVNLSVHLEGPAPWRARGRGSIDLFFFDIPLNFDVTWGPPPPQALPVPEPGRALRQALERKDAWLPRRRPGGVPSLRLTADADRRLGRGTRVDPYGSLGVRQRRVPLGVAMELFERVPMPAAQVWDVTAPGAPGDIRDQFAPAQYIKMSDDQQLGRPSFEQFKAGVELGGGTPTPPPERRDEVGWETTVVTDEIVRFPQPVDSVWHLATEVLVANAGISDSNWWATPDVEPVVVADEAPVAVANAWSMQPTSAAGDAPTHTELLQAVEADVHVGLRVVEAWEMV